MANPEVCDAILLLARAMTAQLNRQKVTLEDANVENVEGQNMKEKRMREVKRARHEGNLAKGGGSGGKQPQGQRPNVPNQRFIRIRVQ